jgi:hypothetical protein
MTRSVNLDRQIVPAPTRLDTARTFDRSTVFEPAAMSWCEPTFRRLLHRMDPNVAVLSQGREMLSQRCQSCFPCLKTIRFP